jgi:transcriptional regulator with XRE-family HTH domain
MPDLLPSGNYSADEALAVIQARNIIRARRKLSMSQADFARRAGIRLATLARIEQARGNPSVATIEKIDRALRRIEAGANGRKARKEKAR